MKNRFLLCIITFLLVLPLKAQNKSDVEKTTATTPEKKGATLSNTKVDSGKKSNPNGILDIVGKWTWKNDKQPLRSYSYYTLNLTKEGKVMLNLTTNYFSSYFDPYYIKNEQSIEGTYSHSSGFITFNWNKASKKNSDLSSLYECSVSANQDVQSAAKEMNSFFDQFINRLNKVKVSDVSENYFKLLNVYTLSRQNNEDVDISDAIKNQNEENKLSIDIINGNVSSFKHIYNDGVVTIENGTMTINYANGDKYVGTGYFGVITSEGTMVGSTKKIQYFKKFAKAALNVPNISDLEVFFKTGTLTKAGGKSLTFSDGLTHNQNSQIEKNIKIIANSINELVQQDLVALRKKCASTKAQLLKEGFSAYYVNSIFNNYRILEGTPQELIDRALQLGCHMQKHPISLSDVTFDVRKSGKTYAIVITNPNTGEDAFSGFVKFHWSSHKAIFVGHQMR